MAKLFVAVIILGGLLTCAGCIGLRIGASWQQREAAAGDTRPGGDTSVPVAAAPANQPAAAPAPSWVVVANTGGLGVYIRRSPRMNDKTDVAWVEGTKLEVIGPDTEGEGRRWKHVRDPKGNIGWVPADFVVPA